MKQSRRHRWVKLDHGMEVCRDCGLEVMSDRIKGGGLGPCAGKACEHQNVLALMNLVPQDVGNVAPGNYFCACASCGVKSGLEMLAHHDSETGKMTGWLFTCERCMPALAGSKLVFVPEAGAEKEGASE